MQLYVAKLRTQWILTNGAWCSSTLPHPEIRQNFRVKLHSLSFLCRCLMLDDGFKLKCSVDFKKGRGKRKNWRMLVLSLWALCANHDKTWHLTCYTCDIIYPNLVTQFSHGMITQCKQMYKQDLYTKEQKFGNVKIAHFALFLPRFETQKNVNTGN